METLLIYNEREADLLKKEFNMPDKRYYWIKIQGYAKRQAWAQLMEFGRKGSSPIGYEVMFPFIRLIPSNRPSSLSWTSVSNTTKVMKLVDMSIERCIPPNLMTNVFHTCSRKFSKADRFMHRIAMRLSFSRMIDEAIAAAIKLKSPEALDFIEAKCQSNETNQTKVRQARERVQDPGKGWLLGGFLKS